MTICLKSGTFATNSLSLILSTFKPKQNHKMATIIRLCRRRPQVKFFDQKYYYYLSHVRCQAITWPGSPTLKWIARPQLVRITLYWRFTIIVSGTCYGFPLARIVVQVGCILLRFINDDTARGLFYYRRFAKLALTLGHRNDLHIIFWNVITHPCLDFSSV